MDRNKIKMNKNLLIVLAFLLFNIGYGQTKTWTGAASNEWDEDLNWTPPGKPAYFDSVLITNATNQPVISSLGIACATLELKNSTPGSAVVLTVESGDFSSGSITMNNTGSDSTDCSLNIDSGTVTVTGNVTMNGNSAQNDITFLGSGNLSIGGTITGGTLNSAKGTVDYNGTGTHTVGNYIYNNLTFSGSGIRTIGSEVAVNGTLTFAGSATVSAAPTYGPNAALKYNTSSPLTVGPEWVSPFFSKKGVQIAGKGVITIGSNLEKIFDDGIPLIIDDGAFLKVGENSDMYLGGDFKNNKGTLKTDSYIYLKGEKNQQIGSFESTKGVVMNKTAGIATFISNINTQELRIDGLGGTLNLGAGLTHEFNLWTRTQGVLNAGSCLLKIAGNVVGTGGSFNPSTSTVEFNGGAQNLGTGSIVYNNLTLSGTATKTFGAKTTINNTFSIVDGVIANLTANLVHTAKTIKLGITDGAGGSWGSSLSNAVNKNNTFFASNNGIVNVGPTIAVSTNNIAALSSVYGEVSSSKFFTISGNALVAGIVVTPPAEFEVSTDGIIYSNTLNMAQAGGYVGNTVYVRLKGTINAGDYSGDIVLTSTGTTDVKVAIAKSTVNKAPLTITAINANREYGDDDPTFTASYGEFKNGDTEASFLTEVTTITLTTTAIKSSEVRIYPIKVNGPSSSKNYLITYGANAELNITPALLTIKADHKKIEHGVAYPELTLTYTGFKNEETKDDLKKPATAITTAVKDSPVGEYKITASGAESKNYTFKYVDNILEIVPSSNAGLSDIDISNGTFDEPFDTGNKDYKVEVPNEINTYVINPIPSNPNATVEMQVDGKAIDSTAPFDLKVGDNEITIVVTAEDGTTQETYTVIVTREPSHEARLSDLVINGVDFNKPFDKDKEESRANVPNETTSIVITPTPMESNETVKMFVDGIEVTDLTAPVDLKVGDNKITYVVTAQDGTTEKEYTVVVNRAEPLSNDGNLTDLAISEGTLSPAFAEGTKDYTATVPNNITDITLTPITSDPTAIVTIKGKEIPSGTPSDKLPLEVGVNKIETLVKAEDGTITTYTVIVTREPSHNAGLSDIVVSEGTLNPIFDVNTKDYKVEVPNETTSIIVTPSFDPNAKIEMKVDGVVVDPTAPIDLKVGDNVVAVVVTAEDGTTTDTYTVIVTREPSHNAGLSDIVVSEGTLNPIFDVSTKDYKVEVPNETTSIIVTPSFDPNAKIEMKVDGVVVDPTAPIDLKVGDNVVTVVVTAEDGTTTDTYTVIVTREDATSKPSDNAGLADITVSDGTLSPAFNTDTKDYKVDVPYETDSIVITPKTIDPTATVEMKIDGVTITDPTTPIDLKVGDNVITVVVTAEDGTQETYTVIVNRADEVPQAIVPSNIITPNGDGKNDTWVIPGLDKYPNNSVKVFDRAARLVYSKDNYNNDWDGTFKGSPVNEDTYYYLIDLGNGTPKLKGFISILRN